MISERANESLPCKSLHNKELQGYTLFTNLEVCRIGRTEEAKECWSGLRSDCRLHESMLSQNVGLGYPLPQHEHLEVAGTNT